MILDQSRTDSPIRFFANAALVLVASLPAQRHDTQSKLAEKRDTKLAKPVFKKNAWHIDYATACRLAERDGRLILAYFTKSYSP